MHKEETVTDQPATEPTPEPTEQSTVASIMAGTCATGPLDCSLVEFLRGLKYFMDEESRGFRCDTHLLNLLRRAACVAWELERDWNARSHVSASVAPVDRIANDAANKIADYFNAPASMIPAIEKIILRCAAASLAAKPDTCLDSLLQPHLRAVPVDEEPVLVKCEVSDCNEPQSCFHYCHEHHKSICTPFTAGEADLIIGAIPLQALPAAKPSGAREALLNAKCVLSMIVGNVSLPTDLKASAEQASAECEAALHALATPVLTEEAETKKPG